MHRMLNPVVVQLTPLSVVLSNGADQSIFNGCSLIGLRAMPLVLRLSEYEGTSHLSTTVSRHQD